MQEMRKISVIVRLQYLNNSKVLKTHALNTEINEKPTFKLFTPFRLTKRILLHVGKYYYSVVFRH